MPNETETHNRPRTSLSSCFCFPLPGVKKTPDRVENSEPVEGPSLADLKETDSLVIYTYTGNVPHQPRINQFSALYDVDVEVVRVDGHISEYTERVMNDLASGSGPDVLFVDDLYSSDIAKIALKREPP